MKKFLISLLLMFVLVGCGTGAPNTDGNTVLKLFNWGEYIGENTIAEFESEYGVRVISSYYSSNEEMYVKLQAGEKFDLLVPSDYMIQRLIAEEQLQKIDVSQLENFDNIMPSLLDMPFDPENDYSVPYLWGNVGIVYVKDKVDVADLEADGWDILRNEKYRDRIFMYDSERDGFMVALKALGYSMNTEDPTELEAAYNWLLDMNSKTKPIYVMDEIIDQTLTEQKDLAVMYSGDAAYITSENENLGFYVPQQQGTNIWLDSMVIPVNAENPELAMKFIDFVLEDDQALEIVNAVGYTTVVQSVFDEVTGPGGDYEDNHAFAPVAGPKDEEFFYNADTRPIIADYWNKVKSSK